MAGSNNKIAITLTIGGADKSSCFDEIKSLVSEFEGVDYEAVLQSDDKTILTLDLTSMSRDELRRRFEQAGFVVVPYPSIAE